MAGFISSDVDVAEENYENSREKARKLLRSVVPKKTWCEYEETSFIRIEGKDKIYLISPYSQTEIRNKETGKIEAYACLQLNLPAPTFDRMAAEYILIKNAEDFYWETARISLLSGNEFGIATPFLISFDIILFVNLLSRILITP